MKSTFDRYQENRRYIDSEDDVEPEIPDKSDHEEDNRNNDKFLVFDDTSEETVI